MAAAGGVRAVSASGRRSLPSPRCLQVKIQPPELKGMMDKKLSGERASSRGCAAAAAGGRCRRLRCVPTFCCSACCKLLSSAHIASIRAAACCLRRHPPHDAASCTFPLLALRPLRYPRTPSFRPPPCPPAAVKLNANRHVTGVLRGFDQFMNLVLDGTVDEKLKADLGMVVSVGLYAVSPSLLGHRRLGDASRGSG